MSIGTIEAAEPKKDKEDKRDYEAESAADNIIRAHEHMADPEMMKRVKPHLDKKMKAIKSISDLKKRAKVKLSEPEPMSDDA